MRSLEHNHAVALMNWWSYFANLNKIDPRLLFAIPNQGRGGGWRHARRGAYMKREGLRAGIPDYFLAAPTGNTPGLFLELKAPGGIASPAQVEILHLLHRQGYSAFVVHGWEMAKRKIEEYLGIQTPV